MPFGIKYLVIKRRNNKGSISPNRRKIYVYSADYILIEQFDSVTSASIKYNLSRQQIRQYIQRNKLIQNIYFSYNYPYQKNYYIQ